MVADGTGVKRPHSRFCHGFLRCCATWKWKHIPPRFQRWCQCQFKTSNITLVAFARQKNSLYFIFTFQNSAAVHIEKSLWKNRSWNMIPSQRMDSNLSRLSAAFSTRTLIAPKNWMPIQRRIPASPWCDSPNSVVTLGVLTVVVKSRGG